MKTFTIQTAAALALAALAAESGCIRPPRVDPGVIARYQRAMMERSGRRRGGKTPLEVLRPAPGVTGPDLKIVPGEDGATSAVHLSLDDAVMLALANSLDIAVVGFNPAVAREEMIAAAAEFDATLYGTVSYQKSDQAVDNSFFGGLSKTHLYEVGLRKKTITGATASLAWTMTKTWDNAGFRVMQPRFEPIVTAEISQPLLRDAWPEFNLATLKIARLSHRTSMAAFRQRVEQVVTDVIGAYWLLVQARESLVIQQGLLDETLTTLHRVQARAELDATAVQIKQAEAAVERRRAVLVRARKTILDVQDALARLLADSRISPLDEVEIVPTTVAATAKVEIDMADQLAAALTYSPLLAQARLAVATAEVNVHVARNQVLPRLDLTLSGALQGLGRTEHTAHQQLYRGDWAGYAAVLTFEYPIANRELRARFRRSRLERLKAVTEMQNTVDLVAQSIRERIREVRTTYEEMLAHRATAAASLEQLRALEDTEKIRGRLTPEFLAVKLAAQESTAAAKLAELNAVAAYNTAQVELAREVGTVLELHRVQVAISAAGAENAPSGPGPATPPAEK